MERERFRGRVALVTGAYRGLGAAICRGLADEGATVIVTDIEEEGGRKLAEELGKPATFRKLDVTSEADWASAAEAVSAEFGGLHVLVNNAGWTGSQRIADATLESYMKTINICQVGPFLGTRAAIPLMTAVGGGSIVNIGSVDGVMPQPFVSAYSSAKAALRAMTKSAAGELAPLGIRCNAVHFGLVMGTDAYDRNVGVMDFDAYAKRLPIGRFAELSEIVSAVLYLASDDSSYCTGSDLIADGGKTQIYAVPRL
jgi:3alpha(or 20beta)-hydroxysteroid dehydrogenase